jgi:hypothetical protein
MTSHNEPLAFFLNHPLYTSDQHDYGYEKYVYDDEFIHYGLLSILLQASSALTTRVLQTADDAVVKRVMPGLRRHPFDLEVDIGDAIFYFEIKTWSSLTEDQFTRQTQFLHQSEVSRAIYLLPPLQSRFWDADRIERESNGRSQLLRFSELARAVSDSLGSLPPPIDRIAKAYLDILPQLEKRAA